MPVPSPSSPSSNHSLDVNLFHLIFLALTAIPAGLLCRSIARRSLRHEILAFVLPIVILSALVTGPANFAALRAWFSLPNDPSPLIELALLQAKILGVTFLFVSFGWIITYIVEGIFED